MSDLLLIGAGIGLSWMALACVGAVFLSIAMRRR